MCLAAMVAQFQQTVAMLQRYTKAGHIRHRLTASDLGTEVASLPVTAVILEALQRGFS